MRTALAAVRAALTDEGRFAFETRNPAVRGWERWGEEYTLAVRDPAGSGGLVRMTIRPRTPVTGDVVRAVTRLTGPAWSGLRTSTSTWRFLDADAVTATFDRIRADARHHAVVVLSDKAVAERSFGRWAMAHRLPTDPADEFDERVTRMLRGASDNVRGTFLGLIAVRR